MTTLHTERLILRPWTENDASALFELGSDPSIGLNAGWTPIRDILNAQEIIRNVLSDDLTFAITQKDSNELVGCISLKPVSEAVMSMIRHESESKSVPEEALDFDHSVEMGYWLGVPYRGKGFMREAAQTLLKYAFEDLSYTAVWALHEISNRNSERVMEHLGMRGVGVVQHVLMPNLPGVVFWDEHIHLITYSE